MIGVIVVFKMTLNDLEPLCILSTLNGFFRQQLKHHVGGSVILCTVSVPHDFSECFDAFGCPGPFAEFVMGVLDS